MSHPNHTLSEQIEQLVREHMEARTWESAAQGLQKQLNTESGQALGAGILGVLGGLMLAEKDRDPTRVRYRSERAHEV